MITYTVEVTKMVRVVLEEYEPWEAIKAAITDEDGSQTYEVHAEVVGDPVNDPN